MKLIISNKFLTENEREKVATKVEGEYQEKNLDGYTFNEIKEMAEKESEKVYVTSDERLLMLYPKHLKKEDVYITNGNLIKNIQECTRKELRPAHSIFRMYVANAFQI